MQDKKLDDAVLAEYGMVKEFSNMTLKDDYVIVKPISGAIKSKSGLIKIGAAKIADTGEYFRVVHTSEKHKALLGRVVIQMLPHHSLQKFAFNGVEHWTLRADGIVNHVDAIHFKDVKFSDEDWYN